MKEIIISRIISIWIITISLIIANINMETKDSFYKWGPHPDLQLFGITVDTWSKYSVLVLYTLINTCLRNVEQNVIRPFIVLNIQDDSYEAMCRKKTMNHAYLYEITVLTTLYTWFDWFMYIKILLTQVDMIFIEASTDIAVSLIVTMWYLKKEATQGHHYQPIHPYQTRE